MTNNLIYAYSDDKYIIENTPENIANFISYYDEYDVVITDLLDQFICSSMFGFLDRVKDPETRQNILNELLKYQLEDKEPTEPTIIELIECDDL